MQCGSFFTNKRLIQTHIPLSVCYIKRYLDVARQISRTNMKITIVSFVVLVLCIGGSLSKPTDYPEPPPSYEEAIKTPALGPPPKYEDAGTLPKQNNNVNKIETELKRIFNHILRFLQNGLDKLKNSMKDNKNNQIF